MYELIFDKNSLYWNEKYEHNLAFLLAQERYLHDLCKARGYIYFNEIYETLGICWTPNRENICLIYNDKLFYQFQFEVFREKNGSLRIIIVIQEKEPF